MLNFIIVGHGTFATKMQDLMTDFHYDVNRSFFINYSEIMTPVDLDASLKHIMFDSLEEFLIVVDLNGGSPYNKSVAIALENSRVRVISGCSVPMLKSLSSNQDKPLAELLQILKKDSIDAIQII